MLAAGRQALSDWEAAKPGSVTEAEADERMTSAFGALDNWLSNGGRRPGDWVHDGLGGDIVLAHQETAEEKARAENLADVHKAFHDLVVKERDYAYVQVANRDAILARQKEEINRLREEIACFSSDAGGERAGTDECNSYLRKGQW